jgi:hypothetical protein
MASLNTDVATELNITARHIPLRCCDSVNHLDIVQQI